MRKSVLVASDQVQHTPGCTITDDDTPQPLYNTVRYNTVLDITRISVGPQMVIFALFSFITIHFTLVITRFGKLTRKLAWTQTIVL